MLGVQPCQDLGKGIMRWYAMLQSQHLFQPLLLGPPKSFFLNLVVRSADDSTYGNHYDVVQLMTHRPFDTGVFPFRNMLNR